MRKMIALEGIERATVIPQPAYSPRTPCARYIARAVPRNVGRGCAAPPRGRSSSSVCIALLTESAGKSERLNIAPAHAPESADSQGRMSRRVSAGALETLLGHQELHEPLDIRALPLDLPTG